MTDRIFVDSNIWVYLFTEDDDKKRLIARKFISENVKNSHLIISFQVINEVCRVLKKKGFSEDKLRFVIDCLIKICEVHESTIELSFKASELRENEGFSFWDSHIVAHAIGAGSNLLASEDMQNGQIIENALKIANPFAE